MARALAKGFVAAMLLPPGKIAAFDAVPAAIEQFLADVPGAVGAKSNVELAERGGVIILAVKPQSMPAVMAELAGKIAKGTLVVSIAAGVTLAKLTAGLKTDRVIRVMPNTPALVGKGASAYALGSGATPEDSKQVASLLEAVGIARQVDEKLLDAVTGLSGSGPAFVYTIIEALSDGGVRVGLPRELALALAAQTVLGSAQMVLSTSEHPAVLKDRVASPGGTTIAGMKSLEEHGLRAALIAAVEAATKRSQELGV
ncbi:MAG: pyrroline-5-carboxylate reductase [Planctomycetales bacterium]|nr:pyrroline-5-carboxylate reductase [Planctomycetales bacterium]